MKPLPKSVREAAARKLSGEPDPARLERWNILSTSDLATPLPPIPWVCEPLGLAPGAVSLVAGYGYSRKTMAMQSLGLAVAAGKPAWGLWSVRKGPFVHLDYEQGRRLTQERYQRLARGMGFNVEDLPGGALRVACMPRAYLDEKGIIDEVVQLIGDASFVLVDSLRAAFPHADENSSEVRAYLDVLSRASESTGAAIAVIHHARKPNAQNGGTATHAIRGSSALFDACQSVYVFEGEKDTPTTVHHQKDRVRGATLAEFGLTSEDLPGASGLRDGLVVRHLDAEQVANVAEAKESAREEAALMRAAERIVAKLSDLGGAYNGSVTSARDVVGVKMNVFKSAWTRLVAAGVLVREGGVREPVWRLTNQASGTHGTQAVPRRYPVPPQYPVPGTPPLREGTGLNEPDGVSGDEPGTQVRPRLIDDDDHMFSDLLRGAELDAGTDES